MTEADLSPFRASLERTAATYGKALPAEMSSTYFSDLKMFPLAAVLAAIDKARQTGKFFPRVATLRELCATDSSVAIPTDIPSWVNHDEAKYYCQNCDDTGYVRRLECGGTGDCHIKGCGLEGRLNEPHPYTRACRCRSENPILRRQRELAAARTARTE